MALHCGKGGACGKNNDVTMEACVQGRFAAVAGRGAPGPAGEWRSAQGREGQTRMTGEGPAPPVRDRQVVPVGSTAAC